MLSDEEPADDEVFSSQSFLTPHRKGKLLQIKLVVIGGQINIQTKMSGFFNANFCILSTPKYAKNSHLKLK